MGKSILIVEDEQNIVDILSFNLRREGYDTLEAYDGPTGLQLALEQDPDLILLGGDLVTFPNPEYENMLSLCRSLADVAPLYGVLGNHESEMIYGGVDDQLAEKFSEAGVQLLRTPLLGLAGASVLIVRCPGGLLVLPGVPSVQADALAAILSEDAV